MKLLKRILRKEAGQVLPMALILMVIGSLVIIPTLNFATTNLKATQEVDQRTRELYAADAGIADALWYLQSDQRVDIINPQPRVWPHEYWLDDYQPAETVNDKDVLVNISTAWLLSGLPGFSLPVEEPPPGDYLNANNHWTVIGAINIDVQPRKNYIVDISTNESADITLDHIGIWLPEGYTYDGNMKINGVPIDGPGTNYTLVKNPDPAQPFRSGNVYKWDYFGTTFKNLSDVAPPLPPGSQPPAAKYPTTVRLSFDYKVTPFREAKGFFPWIQLSTSRIAWDSDAGFYHVQSTSFTPPSDNTTVEAYVPRGVVRYVSGSSGAASAIQGDYIAIGNSLMTCCWASDKKTSPVPPAGCNSSACTSCCGNNPYRNYAPAPVIFTSAAGYADGERESYATVLSSGADAVPGDAKIERAYLYWTAWLRGDKVWVDGGQGTWLWTSIMGADANWEAKAPQNVKDWLKANAYDGRAYLAVNDVKVTPVNAGDPLGTVVADTWYISEGSNNVQPSYQYSCLANVTAQVKAIIPTLTLPGAKFTVAGVHANASTPATSGDCTTASPGIDWSRSPNAGWSMVIIYSSAEKKTHQIYLYQGCEHLYGGSHEFVITGFAAPAASDLLPGETNEAKMTVFTSEGDVNYPASPATEYLGFKGQQSLNYAQLYGVSGTPGVYTWDVFNSISSATGFTSSQISQCGAAGSISGIDMDTYTSTNPSGGTLLSYIVQPLDTSAKINVASGTGPNTGDGFEIIYLVFSVRSTAVPSGTEFNVGSMLYRIQ
jgi:hypothetical protein